LKEGGRTQEKDFTRGKVKKPHITRLFAPPEKIKKIKLEVEDGGASTAEPFPVTEPAQQGKDRTLRTGEEGRGRKNLIEEGEDAALTR